MLNAIDVNPNNQNPKKRYSLNTLYCRSLDVVADKFPKLPITELNTTLMHVLIVLIISVSCFLSPSAEQSFPPCPVPHSLQAAFFP